MISIPPWVVGVVGPVVALFGIYRIYIGIRPNPAQAKAKGLYGMGGRTHILIGIVYVVMGSLLLASAFGFRLFGGHKAKPAPAQVFELERPIPGGDSDSNAPQGDGHAGSEGADTGTHVPPAPSAAPAPDVKPE